MSTTITMKQLLESGIHFGHQTRRWNPKMGRYIFGERHGIYIIDLQKTIRQLQRAYRLVRQTTAQGGTVLFVGTKKQAQDPVREQAARCGQYYVNNRWLGGMLTNWTTIEGSIRKLTKFEEMEAEGKMSQFKKKEQTMMQKERERLEKNLLGIKDMGGLPSLVFIVDSQREEIAVREAKRMNIPCIAICDTNSDPDAVDVPIPGNDDAIRAINLFCSIIADAAIEGRQQHEKEQEERAAKAAEEAARAVKSAKLARQQAKSGEAEDPVEEKIVDQAIEDEAQSETAAAASPTPGAGNDDSETTAS